MVDNESYIERLQAAVEGHARDRSRAGAAAPRRGSKSPPREKSPPRARVKKDKGSAKAGRGRAGPASAPAAGRGRRSPLAAAEVRARSQSDGSMHSGLLPAKRQLGHTEAAAAGFFGQPVPPRRSDPALPTKDTAWQDHTVPDSVPRALPPVLPHHEDPPSIDDDLADLHDVFFGTTSDNSTCTPGSEFYVEFISP